MQPLVSGWLFKQTSALALKGKKSLGQLGRNPIETMNRWKYITLYREVLKVQSVCREALKRWHYQAVESELDLPEFNFVQEFYGTFV